MNTITLVGRVEANPVYYCTNKAADLTRFRLVTLDRQGKSHHHHCLAYGPAACCLHAHLSAGCHLLVRGELLYRERPGHAGEPLPYILVRSYSYLDRMAGPGVSRHAVPTLRADG